MHDDHRESFTNRNDDHSDDEASRRWRRSEGQYRREAQDEGSRYRSGEPRFDEDPWGRSRQSGSGQEGARSGSGRDYDQPTYYGGRSYGGRNDGNRSQGGRNDSQPVHHWHAEDRERRAGHPYEGTYGGTGDFSYFTGSQGSWAVGAPKSSGSYGAGGSSHFGADYRSHGYADHDDDRHRGFWDRASDEVASWFGDEDAARRRDEDHRGRGPSDYTRSDERIREDANDRLTEDWRVDARMVTVSVEQGEITLNGTVSSREAKRRAEDVVDDISGVKHVQNNLRVQAASGTAYGGSNRATSQSSTAEGGTLGTPRGNTATQSNKL